MDYESVGLRAPYRPLTELITELGDLFRKLSFFGHTTRDAVEDLYLIHYTHTVATSQSGWVEMYVVEIMQGSWDRAIDGDNWCDVLHGRLR